MSDFLAALLDFIASFIANLVSALKGVYEAASNLLTTTTTTAAASEGVVEDSEKTTVA